MTAVKLLFSKNYWKYIFSLRKLINDVLAAIGVVWLVVEASSFFSNDISSFFKTHWVFPLTVAVIWILYESRPRTEYCYKLKDRDIRIQISIGSLFNYKGDLIIPVNTSFDTAFENDLISRNSTQGQFTIKYFKEPRYLEQDIATCLAGEQPSTQLPNKQKGNKYKYDIGTILKLKLQNDRYSYLVAVSDLNDSGVASTNFDNILTSLGALWDFIIQKGEIGQLNIPILGTGRGRVLETRETIIKAIVRSFISSTSTGKRFSNKLNIVILPKDFSDHELNIKKLREFLKLTCEHYEYDTTVSGGGQSIE